MTRAAQAVFVASLLLVVLVPTRAALACAVCSNPRFDSADEAAPAKRGIGLRSELDFRFGSAGAGETSVDDRRLDLELGYRVLPRLDVSVDASVLERTVRQTGASSFEAWTPGDVELRATGELWSSGDGPAQQTLMLGGGSKLPSAPEAFDAAGRPLSGVLQPGCNAVTPFVALSYAYRLARWGFDTSLALYLPIAVRDAPHAGESVRGTFTFELRPLRHVLARTGLGSRYDPSGELAPDVSDPNSGGLVGTVNEELAIGPFAGWEMRGGIVAPVLHVLHGDQRLSAVFTTSLSKTF
jgi:hypothetical protein